ncbi:uncharacterized protein [Heterodontus francisci]|uniref:uncharacterized protein n=1 Tax=Heterodontus francisci TaxID=7792 RepID=UPI00355BA315
MTSQGKAASATFVAPRRALLHTDHRGSSFSLPQPLKVTLPFFSHRSECDGETATQLLKSNIQESEMALGALFVGLFVLFQHVAGSTYLFSRGSEDVTTLQCNMSTGAGNVVTLCSTSNLGVEMDKITCEIKKSIKSCETINPRKNKWQKQPMCKRCKINEDEMESQSLAFNVKPVNSVVFTCTVQNSKGRQLSNCPSWFALSGDGCENHDLFILINWSDSDEIFSADKNSLSLTVSEGENVTLPCQFETRKDQNLPFTLFWITSGNVNKCLHSVHIEEYRLHSDTRCCVDKKSSQRISPQSSHNPTDKHQSHNLTIHSAEVMDTGRYLCAVHVWVSGKPVWKISTNISLTVTEPSAESSDIPTSTSGISSVTSSVNSKSPYTSCSNTRMSILVLYLVALICLDGVICIIRRVRQSAKGRDHTDHEPPSQSNVFSLIVR